MSFRMPFAGESDVPSPDSVLSHCYGALLPMFDTVEALVLRQVCKEFKAPSPRWQSFRGMTRRR
jgi:hypothetical protein